MNALLQLCITAFCVIVVTGCTGTKEAPSISLRVPNEAPVIELLFKSRMMTNQEHLRIYANGTISDNRYGQISIHKIGRSGARRVLQLLEKGGFFALDQKRIALEVEATDDNWQGTQARHSLVMIDATTTTLTAAIQSRNNLVSVTGLSAHLREYPFIAEFEQFKRCVDIVESAVPNKGKQGHIPTND